MATQLGCNMTPNGLIKATEFGQTNVPGMFAAGDAISMFRQVALAVASGSKAAVCINRTRIAEDIELRKQLMAGN